MLVVTRTALIDDRGTLPGGADAGAGAGVLSAAQAPGAALSDASSATVARAALRAACRPLDAREAKSEGDQAEASRVTDCIDFP
jgi:hypothetical protein